MGQPTTRHQCGCHKPSKLWVNLQRDTNVAVINLQSYGQPTTRHQCGCHKPSKLWSTYNETPMWLARFQINYEDFHLDFDEIIHYKLLVQNLASNMLEDMNMGTKL